MQPSSWSRQRTLLRAALVFSAMSGVNVPGLLRAADANALRGTVLDSHQQPVPHLHVTLQAMHSRFEESAQTDAQGGFVLANVPLGDYVMEFTAPGYGAVSRPVTIQTGSIPPINVIVARDTLSTVNITAQQPVTASSATPTTLVDRQDIEMTPGADRSNSLAIITDFVPGTYFVHDQLHVRGGHQTTWAVDGVEIPNTNIASNLGPQLDPKDIDYLEAQRGSYEADLGDRTYGIFNVIPRTGFERDDQGELIVSGGSYEQTNDYLSVGSHTDHFAYYASLNGNRSNLGIQTPTAQILHDAEDGGGGFGSFIYNVNAGDQIRLVVQARRDDYQIPNSPGDMLDDTQREADAFTILSWVHGFNADTTLTSSFFYHYNRADFDGSPTDFPISTTEQRSSSYLGGQEALRWHIGRNEVQAGVLGFSQHDNQSFRVLFNDASAPNVFDLTHPSGSLVAGYLQDTLKATDWLTLLGGVRETYFSGNINESATSPRFGMTIELPQVHWLLRGFWGKFYQAPPLDTLSGPLLQYATASDTGFLPLHGERDTEYQYGINIPVQGWDIDIDHFRTEATNFFDHNPIGNSDVFLPLTINGALIRGSELTVRSPRFWEMLQVHLAYSNQSADGFGTINGGLTDFSPPAGLFALDHDQRTTINTGFDAHFPYETFVSANLYDGSGFSNGGVGSSHLPSHAELDLAIGKKFPDRLTLSVTALNVANKHLLIDNSLTFGGFHYNEPLQVYAELRYDFSYGR